MMKWLLCVILLQEALDIVEEYLCIPPTYQIVNFRIYTVWSKLNK